MRRPTGLMFAVLLAATAFGQGAKPVKLTFASEGDREVWIGPTKDPGLVKDPVAATGTSITIDAPSDGAGWVLYSHDKKTGNVAQRPLAEALKTGEWKVALLDERRVFRMDFLVVSEGKPVASAVVKAKAGTETREALVTPADKGKASIFNLPPGSTEVVVQYKVGDATKTTPPQSFDAKLGAGPPSAKTITISDKVETVAEDTPSTATPSSNGKETKSDSLPKEREQVPVPTNPGLALLNLVLGLAVIGGLCYGIYAYVKKNPKQVEDVLKKAGLGDQTNPTDTQVAPLPPQPQPVKPIVLDDATPTAVSMPIAGAVAAMANPRLVRTDGSIALLPEGASSVGREAPAEIVLDGESSVSRLHARLERTGDSVVLTDAGSTNGTFVNGVKVTGPVNLKVGDSVQFGACSFRYEE